MLPRSSLDEPEATPQTVISLVHNKLKSTNGALIKMASVFLL